MMNSDIRSEIETLIRDKVREIGRPDLFREPLVGFASCKMPELLNIKETVGPWHMEITEMLPSAKSVIAYFVPFTRELALSPNEAKYSSLMWSEAYTLINSKFSVISEAVADYLRSLGYEAATVAATNTYDPADMITSWSHRSMAKACGLGDFGKNRILMTRKGSAVRFCSLVTNCELEPSSPYDGPLCTGLDGGDCNICWDICPADALSRWFEGGKNDCQRNIHYYEYMMGEFDQGGSLDVDTCGKCISACPLAYIE